MAEIKNIAENVFRFTGDCDCYTYDFKPDADGNIEITSYKTGKKPHQRDDESSKPPNKKRSGMFSKLFGGEEEGGE
jgi:hypothetical protein